MAVYTTLTEKDAAKHGIFESSRMKATDIGRIYDALVQESGKNIAVDNGVAIKIGEFTGEGLQEVKATIAAKADKIAIVGTPALVKDAASTAQGDAYNFYNKEGALVKAYEVAEGDIFAIADYQISGDVALGATVVVDGKGAWEVADAESCTFVGKVHSISAGNNATVVRIQCVKNA
jgi:hypothetical protein